MVLIGKRRHIISIAYPIRTPDGQGGHVTTWGDRYTEWAAIDFRNGGRVLAQAGIKFTKSIELVIRERADMINTYMLGPENRIKFKGEYYTIHSIAFDNNDLRIIAYA